VNSCPFIGGSVATYFSAPRRASVNNDAAKAHPRRC
jgi:hypothetical protein